MATSRQIQTFHGEITYKVEHHDTVLTVTFKDFENVQCPNEEVSSTIFLVQGESRTPYSKYCNKGESVNFEIPRNWEDMEMAVIIRLYHTSAVKSKMSQKCYIERKGLSEVQIPLANVRFPTVETKPLQALSSASYAQPKDVTSASHHTVERQTSIDNTALQTELKEAVVNRNLSKHRRKHSDNSRQQIIPYEKPHSEEYDSTEGTQSVHNAKMLWTESHIIVASQEMPDQQPPQTNIEKYGTRGELRKKTEASTHDSTQMSDENTLKTQNVHRQGSHRNTPIQRDTLRPSFISFLLQDHQYQPSIPSKEHHTEKIPHQTTSQNFCMERDFHKEQKNYSYDSNGNASRTGGIQQRGLILNPSLAKSQCQMESQSDQHSKLHSYDSARTSDEIGESNNEKFKNDVPAVKNPQSENILDDDSKSYLAANKKSLGSALAIREDEDIHMEKGEEVEKDSAETLHGFEKKFLLEKHQFRNERLPNHDVLAVKHHPSELKIDDNSESNDAANTSSLGSDLTMTRWALHDYEAEEDDKVNLEKGEEVEKVKDVDGGWTWVRKKENSEGLVPTFYLETFGSKNTDNDQLRNKKIKLDDAKILKELSDLKSKLESQSQNLEKEKIESRSEIEALRSEDAKKEYRILNLESKLEQVKNDLALMSSRTDERETKEIHEELSDLKYKVETRQSYEREKNESRSDLEQVKKDLASMSSRTDERETKEKDISLNIKSPPNQVQDIHRQIVKQMKEVFATKGYKLRTKGEGPTVVTVVSSSRAQADFDRDVKAANLTSEESANFVILRIVPSKDPRKKVEKFKKEVVLLDLIFLADQKATTLLDCNHNKEQMEEMVNYMLE